MTISGIAALPRGERVLVPAHPEPAMPIDGAPGEIGQCGIRSVPRCVPALRGRHAWADITAIRWDSVAPGIRVFSIQAG